MVIGTPAPAQIPSSTETTLPCSPAPHADLTHGVTEAVSWSDLEHEHWKSVVPQPVSETAFTMQVSEQEGRSVIPWAEARAATKARMVKDFILNLGVLWERVSNYTNVVETEMSVELISCIKNDWK